MYSRIFSLSQCSAYYELCSILCIVFFTQERCIVFNANLIVIIYALYYMQYILSIVTYASFICIIFYALYSMHFVLCIVFYELKSMYCNQCICILCIHAFILYAFVLCAFVSYAFDFF